jgi:hypothetical protein
MPMQGNQSEKPLSWRHHDYLPLELWKGWGAAAWLVALAESAAKEEQSGENGPSLVGTTSEVICSSGRCWDSAGQHGHSRHSRVRGIHSSHTVYAAVNQRVGG